MAEIKLQGKLTIGVGPKGKDGTMTFEDLTPEQKETLKGDKGDTGAQGPIGPQGPQGIVGPRGNRGEQGIQGIPGPVGPMGPKGIFEELTEEEKQELIGPQGPVGPKGDKGADGAKGERGEKGERGAIGPVGPAGKDGIQEETVDAKIKEALAGFKPASGDDTFKTYILNVTSKSDFNKIKGYTETSAKKEYFLPGKDPKVKDFAIICYKTSDNKKINLYGQVSRIDTSTQLVYIKVFGNSNLSEEGTTPTVPASGPQPPFLIKCDRYPSNQYNNAYLPPRTVSKSKDTCFWNDPKQALGQAGFGIYMDIDGDFLFVDGLNEYSEAKQKERWKAIKLGGYVRYIVKFNDDINVQYEGFVINENQPSSSKPYGKEIRIFSAIAMK